MSEPRDELADADVISSGREDSGAFAAALSRRMRSPRVRFAGVAVLAGVVAAAAVLVPASRPAARSAAPARLAPSAREDSVTNGVAHLGPGMFASGTANGKQWQLVAENIADPGFGCVPAVSVNGNDADPLLADQHPLEQSPVGDPAFVTLGSGVPGAGFAFVQVPADADWLWADPVGSFQLGVTPVTVTVCGRQFRLAGFAYPLAATLRLHLSFRDRAGGNYTVPAALSAPRGSADAPQVDGMWQSPDPAQNPVAAGTIASGTLFGEHWSIRVTFGKAGDCFSVSTAPPAGSTADRLSQAGCGPISTPQGPSTIMVLPLGSPHPGVVGVGYAVSVGAGVDHLTAELTDGSNVSAQPLVVDGRKYAAFFVPGQLRLFWLNWVDATGRSIAGTTGLPGYGFMQFSPAGLPVLKAESWSYGGIS
ncbi:MAG TPA: hypothetical protein VKU77_12410 [Streptosporangiaceae bacterium]|nr:hypothetical protein [Streptosporangiaceae bacterium]